MLTVMTRLDADCRTREKVSTMREGTKGETITMCDEGHEKPVTLLQL